MTDQEWKERQEKMKNDPVRYDEKGRMVHIPSWAYDDMF